MMKKDINEVVEEIERYNKEKLYLERKAEFVGFNNLEQSEQIKLSLFRKWVQEDENILLRDEIKRLEEDKAHLDEKVKKIGWKHVTKIELRRRNEIKKTIQENRDLLSGKYEKILHKKQEDETRYLEYCKEGSYEDQQALAGNKLIEHYIDMRNSKSIGISPSGFGQDKFFHCKGHCLAARCGEGGKKISEDIGIEREKFDVLLRPKGESISIKNQHQQQFEDDNYDDLIANRKGATGDINMSCEEVCNEYITPDLSYEHRDRYENIKDRYKRIKDRSKKVKD